MSTQSLYRYGGIAAIISVLAFIASLALPALTGDPAGVPVIGAYAISSLASLVTLYALYVLHRSEAAMLSLLALITAVLSTILGFGADYTDPSSPLMLGVTVLYAIAALLYGWLAYHSLKPLKAIGISALVVSGLATAAAFLASTGWAGPAGSVLMVANGVWVIWFLMLAWYFLALKPVALLAR